jgi:creatinine amidohydrolase/Fe(II)-dependent formamide hydrolase-like protein
LDSKVKKRFGKSTGKYFENLRVIDRLEVGPVRVEPNRLRAPYKVTRQGSMDSTELSYRYEEDVFSPNDPVSLNLGSLISIQVALNYGLFCDEIIFHGVFDKYDMKFIHSMASNTAREIYVKKFMETNPFILGKAAELPLIKKKNYLRAKLTFQGDEIESSHTLPDADHKAMRSNQDQKQYAVLSSGGKDSLLSFGLLREMGLKVHPVFLNESGRHWYTALNAYRYFEENVHNTTRVWTNSDRVFNWMLKHLPFVRGDHSKIRSDEYPIRLWTVAVFLFGALPILRKRGIGRLVIGDELDTTHRLKYKGITHYDGLYDQSRYFDESLTRFFHRKGWGISQFSILRPLSEILIEKTLVTRYPELQKQQVSCHASHINGDRILPCGQCEKCRRIVAMLTALDVDPMNCGYTRKNIDKCLEDLTVKGINQERKSVEHIAYLLHKKEVISEPHIGKIKAQERHEILKLRFDPEKSPIDGIPSDIRKPLYQLLLQHANGAIKRVGRRWIDINPLTDPSFLTPYDFDHHKTEPSSVQNLSYLLGELSWLEAQRRFKEVDVALLPVGAIEQHGPHLPLDADAFDAEYLARNVAETCKDPKPVVLPLIPYGVSYHHEDFSGTISISPETLSALVYDIGMSAVKHGITKLVIINGHGGNSPALHFAAQKINRDSTIFTCVDTGESSDPDIYALSETPNDVHAGEIETSTTLATRPELVRLDKIKKFVPRFSSRYLNFTSKRSIGWYAHTSKISPSGVLGDPTKANREKGEQMWEFMIRHLVEFVEDLKNMTLDEIYQKRY